MKRKYPEKGNYHQPFQQWPKDKLLSKSILFHTLPQLPITGRVSCLSIKSIGWNIRGQQWRQIHSLESCQLALPQYISNPWLLHPPAPKGLYIPLASSAGPFFRSPAFPLYMGASQEQLLFLEFLFHHKGVPEVRLTCFLSNWPFKYDPVYVRKHAKSDWNGTQYVFFCSSDRENSETAPSAMNLVYLQHGGTAWVLSDIWSIPWLCKCFLMVSFVFLSLLIYWAFSTQKKNLHFNFHY